MLAVLILGAVAAPTERAQADDFGTCTSNTGCRADDANMDYCTVTAWPLSYGGPFGDAMVTLDNQTDMYDTYQSACGPHTDIGGYLDKSIESPTLVGTNTLGSFLCTKKIGSSSSLTCDQGSLVINTALATTYGQIRKTLCHEIGHAAGLTHGPTYGGCMVSGYSTNDLLSAHHVAHINAAY